MYIPRNNIKSNMTLFNNEIIYFKDKRYKWIKNLPCTECIFHGDSRMYAFDCRIRKINLRLSCVKPRIISGGFELYDSF